MMEKENIQENEVVETEQSQEETVHSSAPTSLLEEPEETKEEVQKEAEEEPGQPKESEADRNFRELRDKVKRTEKERDEAVNFIKQVELAYQQQQQAQQQVAQQPQEEEISYSDDDLLEGKHLKRERKYLDKEIGSIKKQLAQYKQESTERAVESQLKGMYPDFYEVVTVDNIKALRDMDPYLADSLHSNPDMMSKAISTYRQIKNNGIVSRENYKPQKDKAHANSSKPRSTASLSPQQGDSPLSRANAFANGLTPELKKQLYKEMQEKAKGW